jgi:hypothetical protein
VKAALLAGIALVLVGCSSQVLITSTPSGARVKLDGVEVGRTPYVHRDAKISGYSLGVQLEHPDHRSHQGVIHKVKSVNVGAAIGGLVVWPLWAWVLGYPPVWHAQLQPVVPPTSGPVPAALPAQSSAPVADPSGVQVTLRPEEHRGIRDVFVVALSASTCRGAGDPLALEELAAVRLLRHYRVLERRALDALLAEQRRTMDGLYEESGVVQAGSLAGAQAVVLLRESCVGGRSFLSAKLVACETGAQVWAATSEGGALSELLDAVGRRVAELPAP